MANLISKTSGNWTTASTWGTVEAGSGAVQATISSNTNTTTSYVASSAFTCTNNDVMEGVMLYIRRINATGTFTVGISADNGSTWTREVTVNATDLPSSLYQGWVFFKFGSTLTADGGNDYKIAIKGSSAGNVAVYRDGTTGNWARYIRLSTTAAPQASDVIFVAGEYVSAGSTNTITVTYDQASPSPDFGAINVCGKGLLAFGTAASTNYELKTSGILTIHPDGEMNIGTTSSRIPSTSTATVIFDSVTTGEFGIINSGIFRAHGADKGQPYARLAADASISATSLTLDRSVTWKNGETIYVVATDGTQSHFDERALNADAVANSVAFTSGLTYAHDGTGLIPAAVVLYDRNVKIRGVDSTHYGYLKDTATASTTTECSWVELYWLGRNAAGFTGIDMVGLTVSFTYCTIRSIAQSGCYIYFGSTLANQAITFSYNNVVNFNTGNTGAVTLSGMNNANGTITYDHNVFANLAQLNVDADDKGTFSYNLTFQHYSFTLTVSAYNAAQAFTFTNNELSYNAINQGSNWYYVTIESCKFVNGGYAGTNRWCTGLKFLNCSFTSSNTGIYNIYNSGNNQAEMYMYNCTSVQASTTRGHIYFNNGARFLRGKAVNCTFTGGDAVLWITSGNDIDMLIDNCASTTVAPIASGQYQTSFEDYTGRSRHVRFMRYQQTNGNHFTHTCNGYVSRDTAIYESPATVSERLVYITSSASTATELRSSVVRKVIAAGATPTISVRVRKSSSGDSGGANYDGGQPILVLVENGVASVPVALTATASAAVGTWETLTVTGVNGAVSEETVIEAYVSILGTGSTVGWVNVGAWT